MAKSVYTPDDYDKDNYLKPPGALVLVLLYMMKYIMLVIIPQLPIIGRNMDWISHAIHVDPALLLCTIPALLVTIAWLKRNPKAKAKNWQRWSWLHGRNLLLFSGVSELLLWLGYLGLGISAATEPLILMLYLDFIMVLYLFRSQHLRDAFLEYPDPDEQLKIKAE